MPNKLYPTDVLKQAQDVSSAWNQIGATVTVGTLTPATLTTDVTAATALESEMAKLEAQLTDKRNQRDACQHRREMSTNHRFKKSTFKRQLCPVGFVKLPGAPPFPPLPGNAPTALLCVFLSAGSSRL